MRILQIIPALGAGGAEQAVVDINAALVQQGDASFVVSSGGARVGQITAAGGTHITLPVASKNPLIIIRNSHKLAALIREERIDIIHARSRAPAWSAWLAARQTGCVFLTTFHAAYKFSNALKQRYNRVMTYGVRIITISDFIARHIVQDYGVSPDRVVTIYRGIDLARFNPMAVTPERHAALRAQWGIAPEQRIILLPGRLSRIKGQDVLIEAMRHLQAQGEALDTVAVIIGAAQGRDAYVDELKAQIAAAGLQQRVVLAAHCDDMPAAYALAALVVVPSRVPEGFGRVPVEAQAMGVPVIASDLGATRETILPELTGWLVPPDDASALATQLHTVLQLSAAARQTLAVRAMQRAHDCFALETMVGATLALYQQLCPQAENTVPLRQEGQTNA